MNNQRLYIFWNNLSEKRFFNDYFLKLCHINLTFSNFLLSDRSERSPQLIPLYSSYNKFILSQIPNTLFLKLFEITIKPETQFKFSQNSHDSRLNYNYNEIFKAISHLFTKKMLYCEYNLPLLPYPNKPLNLDS